MAKQYRIDFHINTSQADAALNRTAASMEKQERAAERAALAQQRLLDRQAQKIDAAAERATRAADRKADAEVKAAERAAAMEVRASQQAMMTKERLADRMIAKDHAREVQAVRSADRQADAEVRAAQQAAMAKDRLADRFIAKEHAREVRLTRSAQRQADAEVRATERAATWKQRIYDQAEKKEHDRRVRLEEKNADFAKNQAGIANTFSTIFAGLAGVAAVGFQLAEGIAAANTEILRGAGIVTAYQAALSELAALKGRLGQVTREGQEDIAFRAKTLQTAEESRAFQLAVIGAGESAIDTKEMRRIIGRDEMTKAMEVVGKFQAVEGGEAEAYGSLAGSLPALMGKPRVTGEEVTTRFAQLFKIAQPGKFPTFSSAAKQYAKLTPLISSGLMTDVEAMSVMSALSTVGAEAESGTVTEHLARATVGGIGRMRGLGVEGGQKQGEYLKGLGVTPKMGPIEIADIVAADVARAKAAAGVTRPEDAKGFEMDYLRKHGYGNQQDIMALMAWGGLRKSGVWEKTFKPGRIAEPTLKEVIEPLEEAVKTEPKMMERESQITDIASKMTKSGGAIQVYREIQKTTLDKLKAGGGFSGFMTQGIEAEDLGRGFWGRLAGAEVEGRMSADMNLRRKRLGLPEFVNRGISLAGQAEEYAKSQKEILAAGGETATGTNVAELVNLSKQQLRVNQELRDAVKAGRERQTPEPLPLWGGADAGGVVGTW